MKKIAIIIGISLLLISCNLPFTVNLKTPVPDESVIAETSTPIIIILEPTQTEAPIPTEVVSTEIVPTEPVFEGTEMNLGGVSMVLPACLSANAEGTLIAAQPYDENSGPMTYYPAYRSISFPGYPLSDKFFDPEVRVFPVAEYIAMDPTISDQVNELSTLINTKNTSPTNSIPFLPGFPAAQVFRTQVKYLDFQNGHGVRFLTQYAQYYAPVNNYELFYTFQGLTSDGAYWVSTTFPINASFLQNFYDDTVAPVGGILAPSSSSANYEAEMEAYYANMMSTLNTTADDIFTPGLDCLDQYIQSLEIGS